MKTKDYLLYAVVILLYGLGMFFLTKIAKANIIYNDSGTNLLIEYQTKTKPSAGPKSSYQKYAAVSFISKKSTINSDASGDDLDSMPIKETSCPTGQTKVDGICIDVAACNTSFPLTSVSSKIGSYVTKNCGSKGIRYCYTSCQSGWTHSGCSCTPVDCSEYPLLTNKNQNCNGLKSCKTGDTYKYKCTSCALGYKLNNNMCIAKNCSDYSTMYATSVTAHCTAIVAGKAGEGYCYDCTGCEDGWTLSNTHTCTVNTCNYKTSSITNCIKHTITRTGTDLCYECTACELGYSLNDGHTTCTANSCPTGSSTSFSTVQNCPAVSVTKAGTNFCYKCSN